MITRHWLGWFVSSSLSMGCRDPESPPPPSKANITATPTPPDAQPTPSVPSVPPRASVTETPPAIHGPRFVALEVSGFDAAVVAVPVGAHGPRPIVIATHGNYDRPEWQCAVWAGIVGARAFVLCPRGQARPDSPSPDDIRFTYTNNQVLEREVDAALAALRASPFALHLAEGPPVWAGFSLGAIMGVAIAARRPADFPVLVLIEGGMDRFSDDVARTFARGGGKAVLFACAQRGCAKPGAKRAERLEALGVRATVVDAGSIGHTYDGPVADAVKSALPAFLATDPRFGPPDAP